LPPWPNSSKFIPPLSSLICDAAVVPRRIGVVTRQLSKAKQLYEEGWSLARIGEHFGVHGETVRKALIAAQIPIRPRAGCKQ
jgi:hypothetical protein